jgi:hypothetical protein
LRLLVVVVELLLELLPELEEPELLPLLLKVRLPLLLFDDEDDELLFPKRRLPPLSLPELLLLPPKKPVRLVPLLFVLPLK